MIDYHDFTSKDTPTALRRRLDVGDLWENAAECLMCHDVLRSRNRHDFRTCKCGNMSVDGGSWYARRMAKDLEMIKNHIVMFSDVWADGS